MAFDFLARRVLGRYHSLLYVALGATGRKFAGYRFEGAVLFFEISGTLVDSGGNVVG